MQLSSEVKARLSGTCLLERSARDASGAPGGIAAWLIPRAPPRQMSIDGFDVVHQGEEALRERRVNIDGSLEKGVREPREHDRAEDLDQFASLRRQNGRAQNAVRLGVDDELHQAGR